VVPERLHRARLPEALEEGHQRALAGRGARAQHRVLRDRAHPDRDGPRALRRAVPELPRPVGGGA
jgi:hypothetical protein